MKKILSLVFVIVLWLGASFAATGSAWGSSAWWNSSEFCKDWVKLNTKIPFISWWDGCIEKKDTNWISQAFPELIWWISKLVLALILTAWFIMIVAWWVLYASEGLSPWTAAKWKELIKKVIIWIILLGLSWVILHIINPNFFQ